MVLVGSRGDSATYVRSKKKACADVGIESFGTELPEDVSEEELLKASLLPTLHVLGLSSSVCQFSEKSQDEDASSLHTAQTICNA